MSYTLDIVVIVLSVAAAAFFACAETALTAASRARMHALETAGDQRAKLVTHLIGARGRLISAMLLGGQLVTIGSSAIATRRRRITSTVTGSMGSSGAAVNVDLSELSDGERIIGTNQRARPILHDQRRAVAMPARLERGAFVNLR